MKKIIFFICLCVSRLSMADSTFDQVTTVKSKYSPMFVAMKVSYGIGFCDQVPGIDPQSDCKSIVIRTSSEHSRDGWIALFGEKPFQLEGVWIEMRYVGGISIN